jgi:GxxExxY protein
MNKTTNEPSPEVDRLAHDVIGAALEVHQSLGPGYLESVYEEALCVELELRAIPHRRQQIVSVNYKNHSVGEGRIDLVVDDALVVELKAVDALAPIHTAQMISYLKATHYQLGLLINFNVQILRDGIRRVILSK